MDAFLTSLPPVLIIILAIILIIILVTILIIYKYFEEKAERITGSSEDLRKEVYDLKNELNETECRAAEQKEYLLQQIREWKLKATAPILVPESNPRVYISPSEIQVLQHKCIVSGREYQYMRSDFKEKAIKEFLGVIRNYITVKTYFNDGNAEICMQIHAAKPKEYNV